MITCAKGLTNGVIPMGAVLATSAIHDAFMTGPEHLIELFHGYTYSGNPIASAAGLATLETYREDGLFERAAAMAPLLGGGAAFAARPAACDRHPQRGADRRGGAGADRRASRRARAFQAFLDAYDAGILIRTTGDIIAMSPPLIISEGADRRAGRQARRRAAEAALRGRCEQ